MFIRNIVTAFALILPFTPSLTAAEDLYITDFCGAAKTYPTLYQSPKTHYETKVFIASSPEICCQMCWENFNDCIAGTYEPKTERCRLMLNSKWDMGENKTWACPNGQFVGGEARDALPGWDWWIIGPCWKPSNWIIPELWSTPKDRGRLQGNGR